jgi:hypothetical protein
LPAADVQRESTIPNVRRLAAAAAALLSLVLALRHGWLRAVPLASVDHLDILLKALATTLVSVAVFTLDPRRSRWMSLALLLHAAGDFVIGTPGGFLPSLALFGAGHAIYAREFRALWDPAERLGGRRRALMATFALYAAAALVGVAVLSGSLWLCLYIVIVALMAISALGARRAVTLLPLGALLYVAADSIIAVERFVVPLPAPIGSALSWFTYYFGQVSIAAGWLASMRRIPLAGRPSRFGLDEVRDRL